MSTCVHEWQDIEEQEGSPIVGREAKECIKCGTMEFDPPIAVTIPARSHTDRRRTDGRGTIGFSAVPEDYGEGE